MKGTNEYSSHLASTWAATTTHNRIVNVDHKTRFVTSVNTGDLDIRSRRCARITRDLNLSTRDVELSALESRGTMKSDTLDTKQVLAGGGFFGEGEGEVLDFVGRPLDA